MPETFDTSELAWLTYKVLYKLQNPIIVTSKRKYTVKIFGNISINMSGEIDFNFGKGWSHSISSKYSNYIDSIKEPEKIARCKAQLEICKELYKSMLNISLMPQTGNLQLTKKGLGNDRLDTFVWALSCYYDETNSLLFNNASKENTDTLKSYLASFKRNDPKAIYNYCSYTYGIDSTLVDKLIESGKKAIDTPERVSEYMDLAYRFWEQKLNFLKSTQRTLDKFLSKEEKQNFNNELKKTENIINKWPKQ